MGTMILCQGSRGLADVRVLEREVIGAGDWKRRL